MPVNTMSLFRGKSRSMFFRLWTLAPRILIKPALPTSGLKVREEWGGLLDLELRLLIVSREVLKVKFIPHLSEYPAAWLSGMNGSIRRSSRGSIARQKGAGFIQNKLARRGAGSPLEKGLAITACHSITIVKTSQSPYDIWAKQSI